MQILVGKLADLSDANFQAIVQAGFSPGEAAEIVAHVALNTFINYFNKSPAAKSTSR
jgi:hypothetical protein